MLVVVVATSTNKLGADNLDTKVGGATRCSNSANTPVGEENMVLPGAASFCVMRRNMAWLPISSSRALRFNNGFSLLVNDPTAFFMGMVLNAVRRLFFSPPPLPFMVVVVVD